MSMNLYVNRRKDAARAEQPPTLTYEIPERLRAQIVHIWRRALGRFSDRNGSHTVNDWWRAIYEMVARETRRVEFGTAPYPDSRREQLLTGRSSTDDALIMIEITFRVLDNLKTQLVGAHALKAHGLSLAPEKAIRELNERFHENDVGYRFEHRTLVRIDGELSYVELVKPTLALLADPVFKVASDEFKTALDLRRSGNLKDSIVAANRAFEATMKAICMKRNWTFDSKAVASALVTICMKNGLFPEWLGNGLATYAAMLKTGLPEVRNHQGGHGAAPDAKSVEDYMAGYATHLAASNIIMLVNADRNFAG